MKIIAGALKGKTVTVKHSKALRPTSAKVRESLFNIIRQHVPGCSFADLYAGSGAVGFEALSRGAESVLFVDIDRHAVDTIKKNPVFYENHLNAAICSDVIGFVTSEPSRGLSHAPFDIVFADAPYNSDDTGKLLHTLEHSWILSKRDALVIIEHSTKKPMPHSAGRLILLKTYRYGDASLSIYTAATTSLPEDN